MSERPIPFRPADPAKGAAEVAWRIGGLVDAPAAARLAEASFEPEYREAWTTGQIAGLLAEMGCDLLQGYLFARAMEVSAFVAWYQARRVAHGAA